MIEHMKRFLLIIMAVMAVGTLSAQPAKRRTTTSNNAAAAKAKKAETSTDRASLMFPTSAVMPEDVVWKRDLYRTLDLMQDKNAPLYYPVEPQGRQVNLFTYLFRLMLTGRINAYTYKLDGVESFEPKDKLAVKDMLERYGIYYEESNGKYTVEANDVPSAEVTRYYIKESVYLDQRTGTFSTKVTALCPVLMRGADDWGGEATPYPLFWLNYDDVAPWLAKLPMMASNYNNTTTMTADDYFTMNRYDGKIYKTNNLQGRALANICKTDSDLVMAQKKIEKEIADFRGGVYGHMTHEDSIKQAYKDSVAAVAAAQNVKVKASSRTSARTTARTTSTRSSRSGAASSKGTSTPTATRVSARRQRR